MSTDQWWWRLRYWCSSNFNYSDDCSGNNQGVGEKIKHLKNVFISSYCTFLPRSVGKSTRGGGNWICLFGKGNSYIRNIFEQFIQRRGKPCLWQKVESIVQRIYYYTEIKETIRRSVTLININFNFKSVWTLSKTIMPVWYPDPLRLNLSGNLLEKSPFGCCFSLLVGLP